MLNKGAIARDLGIQQAVENANQQNDKWSDIAYNFFLNYIQNHSEFMIEDVRVASVGFIPEPPSNRAWGGIAIRAAKNGTITRIGFRNVNNVNAHCTPATVWQTN